jgi:hypothetical protein
MRLFKVTNAATACAGVMDYLFDYTSIAMVSCMPWKIRQRPGDCSDWQGYYSRASWTKE